MPNKLGCDAGDLSQLDCGVGNLCGTRQFTTRHSYVTFVSEEIGYVIILAAVAVCAQVAVAVIAVGHAIPVTHPLVGDVAGIHCRAVTGGKRNTHEPSCWGCGV